MGFPGPRVESASRCRKAHPGRPLLPGSTGRSPGAKIDPPPMRSRPVPLALALLLAASPLLAAGLQPVTVHGTRGGATAHATVDLRVLPACEAVSHPPHLERAIETPERGPGPR